MSEKLYQFDSFIVDAAKHEMREIGSDSKERKLPTPRRQIFAALLYLIENRRRAVSLENLYLESTPGKSVKDFSDPSGYKILQECRRCLGDSEPPHRYIGNAGTKLYRFLHENVKETPIPSARTPEGAAGSHDLDEAVAAWSIGFQKLFNAVVQYYQGKGVPLFSYRSANGGTRKAPLYVRPEWLGLEEPSLIMTRADIKRDAMLSKAQQQFLDLYPKIRKRLGLINRQWNGSVFRLVKLQQDGPQLRLHFEEGWFFDSLACQWVLEHETRCALAKVKTSSIQASDLPIREASASTAAAIERFCETDVARIGISNLILLRKNETTYRVLVRQRGSLSMGPAGQFDAISSGIFDIGTASPDIDLKLEYKVLKEIYEELFRGKDVEKDIRLSDPYFFYKKPGIALLKEMLIDGRALFRVTGFCIDLIHIAPEITTVLVVTDPSYCAIYEKQMKTNAEYGPTLNCEIPRHISNVDRFLAEEFPSHPGRPRLGSGFDPSRWTLPGGFCFYQGVRRAVRDGWL